MARWKSRTLTDGELDFMKVLWENGGATPDEIQEVLHDRGRTLTGGTIRNVLAVLSEKGYVTREKQGKTHVYRAKIDKEQAMKTMAQNLLTSAFNGSESLLMNALLKNRDVRPEELDEIALLIEKHRRREKK